MKKILHLTLKKKWFDMVLSGNKQEEYREIKDYWWRRLTSGPDFALFHAVQFVNGYGKNRPSVLVECKFIKIGTGRPEWGAVEGKAYFVIKLGKILAKRNVEK